jgi:hypothetical protein
VQQTDGADASVVDEHVDAPVTGEDPLDESRALLGDDEVADLHLDAGRLGGELLERRRVAGDADDGVTEPSEAQRALAADAGGGAGEQDHAGSGAGRRAGTGGRRHADGVPLHRPDEPDESCGSGHSRRRLRALGPGPRRPAPWRR